MNIIITNKYEKNMRYLLQERFLGACFGGVIGEQLNNQEKLSMEKIKLNQVSWLAIHQEITTQIPLHFNQSLFWEDLSINSGEKITISGMALAVFPIILYYHDNLHQLEFLLHQSAQYWQIPSSNLDGILWWSTAISLVLREKLELEDLLKQLTVTSQIFTTSFSEDLGSLQILFDRGLSITEATEELSLVAQPSNLPFLLSLYCFYQTPENFTLTMKQAMSVKHRTSDLLVLTGFLSGAYNSRTGLPINWEKFCQNEDNYQKVLQLGRRVFAVWSGVYVPGNNVNISAIVVTPRTLQNRSHLKIISQKEYESK